MIRQAQRSGCLSKKTVPLCGGKEECLAVPVIDVGNDHWAANSKVRNIFNCPWRISQAAHAVQMVQRLERAARIYIGRGPMQGIGPGFDYLVEYRAARAPVLRAEIRGLDGKLLHRVSICDGKRRSGH